MLTIIMALDAQAAVPRLHKLLPSCGPIPASHNMCGSDLFKPVWRTFTSGNGELFIFDMAYIEPTGRGMGFINVYMTAPGVDFDMSHLLHVFLTCHGQYSLDESRTMLDAPPLATIGRIASMTCPAISAKERSIRGKQADVPITVYKPKP